MRMFDKMSGSKIKCLGVPEPNNEMRFGFYPILATGGGFYRKSSHVNHPEP